MSDEECGVACTRNECEWCPEADRAATKTHEFRAQLDGLGTAAEWLPDYALPAGSIPVAALLIVNYIGPDGANQRLVSARGDAPATTYLGMTVKAQADINGWDEEA